MSTTQPTIFLTGATGFAGGTILDTLTRTHSDYHIKALIRAESTAAHLQSLYPNLTPIMGDLSNLPLLKSTASTSTFVIHAAGDNADAVNAMLDGLATFTFEGAAPKLITVTGPRSLIDLSKPITGSLDPTVRPWNDITDAEAILSLPPDRMHAATDQAILRHSVAKDVGVIFVSPGQLFGRGSGPRKKESNAATYYALVKSRGRAFVVGEGSATWSWTSVSDFASAVTFLLSLALSPDPPSGLGGYFFVSTSDVSMRERAEAVRQRLGLGNVESVSVEEAKEMHPFGHIMWGCGERIRADRLRDLGWVAKERDWRGLMEEVGGERA